MIKKIMQEYKCSEKAAEMLYYAYAHNLGEYLNIDVSKIAQLIPKISINRKLFDELSVELEDNGITNKKLFRFNGYQTIVYSENLAGLLNSYVLKYGMSTVVDILVNYYKGCIKNNIKTLTLLNFLKDEKGNGINYYLENNEE